MVLKNRRVKIALSAFWGFCVGVLLYLYDSQLQMESSCRLGWGSVTVIRSNHAIPAGTRLRGDMVRLEVVPRRVTDSETLSARNFHTFMDLMIRVDVAEGEILALDHVYEPHSPPLPVRYY